MDLVGILLLSTVFAWAGWNKLRAPVQFRAVLRDLVPGSFVRGLSVGIPLIEFATAFALLSGVLRPLGAVMAIVLLVLFTAALARMWRMGITQDCGCFGEVSDTATPASGIVRNLGLLALAVAISSTVPEGLSQSASFSDVSMSVIVAGSLIGLWTLGSACLSQRRLLLDGVSA